VTSLTNETGVLGPDKRAELERLRAEVARLRRRDGHVRPELPQVVPLAGSPAGG
jgi:hypothetical protein